MSPLSAREARLPAPPDAFPRGRHPVLARDDGFGMGLDFEIVVQEPGDAVAPTTACEELWVLLDGRARVACEGALHDLARASLFDVGPSALHVGAGTQIEIACAARRTEWAVARVENPRRFAPRVLRPDDVASERRGAGLAQGACARTVRLLFDGTTRPESNLVAGEVVCDAGRWSSYPPHAHAQPEIYHYRFTEPQGWGHAELGQDVVQVRSGDTLRIPGGATHAQVAAPGYGMWYLWIVRHLPGRPYTGFEFDPAHVWLLDPSRQGWEPRA